MSLATRRLLPAFFVISLATLALLLLSPDQPVQNNVLSTANAGTPSLNGGLSVRVDPETGDIIPGHPPNQFDQAMGPNYRSAKGLVPVYHPNGAVSLDTQGRYRSFSIGKAGADGRAQVTCANTTSGVHAATCDHESHQTQSRER